MVKAALRPLSWTIAQLLRLHMVPSSARPSVSQFSLSDNGCLQIFSLKWKDHITAWSSFLWHYSGQCTVGMSAIQLYKFQFLFCKLTFNLNSLNWWKYSYICKYICQVFFPINNFKIPSSLSSQESPLPLYVLCTACAGHYVIRPYLVSNNATS